MESAPHRVMSRASGFRVKEDLDLSRQKVHGLVKNKKLGVKLKFYSRSSKFQKSVRILLSDRLKNRYHAETLHVARRTGDRCGRRPS